MDHQTDDHYDSWLDGAPTWVRVVQAVLIGLVAGLALHALLSLVVLQGSQGATVPKECRKSSPTKAQPLKPAAAIRPAVWINSHDSHLPSLYRRPGNQEENL